MKRLIVAIAAITTLTACGSFGSRKPGMNPPEDTAVAVKDTRISTDFSDQGVKIFYTLTGRVDRVEVTGVAPAWRGNVEIVAEADAMDKLVKFVHGQNTSTERRNRIITRTLDRARDNTLNQFRTVDGTVEFDAKREAEDMDREERDGVALSNREREGSERNNTSRRIADRVERGLVEATTTITAQGRLVGVRKIRDRVMQDGRYYVAVYQWSDRDQDASEYIRSRMR